jgi:anti-sigma B factor antagonist
MQITTSVNEDNLIVSISGRLDTVSASDFETFMDENLTYSGNLILDCSDLVYISSAGLRVLLSLQKKRTAGMKLIHVGELVREVFEMTGFIDILTIE